MLMSKYSKYTKLCIALQLVITHKCKDDMLYKNTTDSMEKGGNKDKKTVEGLKKLQNSSNSSMNLNCLHKE